MNAENIKNKNFGIIHWKRKTLKIKNWYYSFENLKFGIIHRRLKIWYYSLETENIKNKKFLILFILNRKH